MVEMGIPRAIVPNHPGQFSAYGFILADARVDRQRTTQLTSQRFDPVRATQVMQELVGDCIAELEAQGYTRDIQITRALEMRYLGQNYELELPVGFERFSADNHGAALAGVPRGAPGALWLQHPRRDHRDRELSRDGSLAARRSPSCARSPRPTGAPAAVGRRAVGFTDGRLEVPIYRREQLAAGHLIDGPAVIEEAASVTVVNPGQRLAVDALWPSVIDAAAA